MAYCDDVNNVLVDESGRIGKLVPAKIISKSPWNRLIKQEAFPEGMGVAINTLVYQRTVVPNVTNTAWSSMGLSNGTGNPSCNPTPQLLEYAQTMRSYNLSQMAVRTPTLCVNDIRYGYDFRKQLGQMFDILTENTQFVWENRYRDEYIRLAQHKVVAAPGLPEDSVNFPAVNPSLVRAIDSGILLDFYGRLLRDSGGQGAYSMRNGSPNYALLISPEASRYIIMQNPEIRQDFRFSREVEELLGPLGAVTDYAGFHHIHDWQAPRYVFQGGQYVRVPYYSDAPTTYGEQADVNPAYTNAPFEATILFNPDVYTSRVVNPITSPGGNTKFDAVNYRGDFQWINFKSECNPLGNTGYFLGTFANGSEAIRPEFGYVLLHQRCNAPINWQSCS